MSSRQAYWLRASLWVALYTVLILLPLVMARLGHDQPWRGFWVEAGVGLGFVGLAMLALQFVLTARFRHIAASVGTDAMLQFHRQAGIVAYFFILAHVVVLMTADRSFHSFFDPRVNLPRTGALLAALVLLTALIVLTIWRTRFKLTYELWRVSHGIMALFVLLIGTAHVLMVGHYVNTFWEQGLWVGLTAGAVYLLVHVRLVKPLLMRRRPYAITAVRQESRRTWSLDIESQGHPGLRFKAGQFIWMTVGDTPFKLQQHPFTIASSAAAKGRYTLTIKELGDFTGTIRDLKPGTTVYLEGPYGAFTLPEPDDAQRLVFIAGGIGITPMMSMLRTMRDTGDPRPITLIFGVYDTQRLVFRDELQAMAATMNLNSIYVLEEPTEDWTGEAGIISPDLLDRHRGEDDPRTHYFLCGPTAMMDNVEQTLRDRGIALRRIHAERFDIV